FRSGDGSPALNPILAVVTSVMALGILWVVFTKGIEAISRQPAHDLADLVGKVGEARTNIREEGTVYIAGEEWTARSTRLILLGSKVRVVARDGLTLIVEPLGVES
ncbi:MAG TPA: NfeD family protein, partial [Anaerolineaceae bacterium]|nr:NfeD family protein [Anaerolineaceae bacterium]